MRLLRRSLKRFLKGEEGLVAGFLKGEVALLVPCSIVAVAVGMSESATAGYLSFAAMMAGMSLTNLLLGLSGRDKTGRDRRPQEWRRNLAR